MQKVYFLPDMIRMKIQKDNISHPAIPDYHAPEALDVSESRNRITFRRPEMVVFREGLYPRPFPGSWKRAGDSLIPKDRSRTPRM